jgi:GxxExxY protein
MYNITRNNTKNKRLLYKELSYIIQGCCFEIRKEYGPGHKETVYANLLKEYLELKGLKVEKEKPIKIYSSKTNKVVGIYRPDLVVNNSILIEVKASKLTTKRDERQLYYYLKNSVYELGYLINFGSPKRVFIKRIIYTNDKKKFLKAEETQKCLT